MNLVSHQSIETRYYLFNPKLCLSCTTLFKIPIWPQWYMVCLMFQSKASNFVVAIGCCTPEGTNGEERSSSVRVLITSIDFMETRSRYFNNASGCVFPTESMGDPAV